MCARGCVKEASGRQAANGGGYLDGEGKGMRRGTVAPPEPSGGGPRLGWRHRRRALVKPVVVKMVTTEPAARTSRNRQGDGEVVGKQQRWAPIARKDDTRWREVGAATGRTGGGAWTASVVILQTNRLGRSGEDKKKTYGWISPFGFCMGQVEACHWVSQPRRNYDNSVQNTVHLCLLLLALLIPLINAHDLGGGWLRPYVFYGAVKKLECWGLKKYLKCNIQIAPTTNPLIL